MELNKLNAIWMTTSDKLWTTITYTQIKILFSDTMLPSSKRSFLKKDYFTETRSSIFSRILEAISQVQGEHRLVETSRFRALQPTRSSAEICLTFCKCADATGDNDRGACRYSLSESHRPKPCFFKARRRDNPIGRYKTWVKQVTFLKTKAFLASLDPQPVRWLDSLDCRNRNKRNMKFLPVNLTCFLNYSIEWWSP